MPVVCADETAAPRPGHGMGRQVSWGGSLHRTCLAQWDPDSGAAVCNLRDTQRPLPRNLGARCQQHSRDGGG